MARDEEDQREEEEEQDEELQKYSTGDENLNYNNQLIMRYSLCHPVQNFIPI